MPTAEIYTPRESLKKTTEEHLPLYLPWYKAAITIGTGFDSHIAADNGNPWLPVAAFEHLDTTTVTAAFETGSASFREDTSSSSSSETSHMSGSLGVTVGNDYLNANVTGSFDEMNRKAKSVSIVLSRLLFFRAMRD